MQSQILHPSAIGSNQIAPSPNGASQLGSYTQKLATANEQTWIQLGALAELVSDTDRAISCYENALRHNINSIKALTQIASLYRIREQFPKAVEYFQRILNLQVNNGEIWGALGHCYLMLDDLQKAYAAYQQALYHLKDPKDPKLWYGIGILYDRYGSFEHAEEAFTAVLKMDPKFEKFSEIYFRLGIIYKQQQKYDQSLEQFRLICQNPPVPLTEADIWFQIGHVYEQKKEPILAKEAYEKVLGTNPNHAKVLQQLGWLYYQANTGFTNQETAIDFLSRSAEADPNDTQTWYLLGRCNMALQRYSKAYEAFQQAVYRDGRNPTYWCSIGVLYFQIGQFRDALDAYTRAIRLNPFISEVWFNLGTLYESCTQVNDAIDAYQRASELDPNHAQTKQRLTLLKNAQATGAPIPPNPAPLLADDMHPSHQQPPQTSHALLQQQAIKNGEPQMAAFPPSFTGKEGSLLMAQQLDHQQQQQLAALVQMERMDPRNAQPHQLMAAYGQYPPPGHNPLAAGMAGAAAAAAHLGFAGQLGAGIPNGTPAPNGNPADLANSQLDSKKKNKIKKEDEEAIKAKGRGKSLSGVRMEGKK